MTITYDDIGIYDEAGYTYDGTLIGRRKDWGLGSARDPRPEIVGSVRSGNGSTDRFVDDFKQPTRGDFT